MLTLRVSSVIVDIEPFIFLCSFLTGLSYMITEGSCVDERHIVKPCLYPSHESSVSKALYFLEVSWL